MAYGWMEGNNIYQIFQILQLLSIKLLSINLLTLLSQTADQGATTVIYAAISKNLEKKGGVYISNCKEMIVPSLALEEKVRKRLFELSLKQTHLENFFQYL